MLETVALCKSYNGKVIVDNFSFRFKAGEHYVLTGASGSGKTTLLHLLLGLVKPDSGRLISNGLRFSAVFQEDRLLEQMTATANVALAGFASHAEIENMLLRLGIDRQSFPLPVSAYSGGMKRRVALCRALMAEYDVLLLDEPYKGLDDATRKAVMQIVAESTVGKTVLLVTHDRQEAVGYLPIQIV